jgi:hypothetical protein
MLASRPVRERGVGRAVLVQRHAERRSRAPAGRASGDGTWLQIAFGAEGHRAAPRGRASAPFVCEQVLELGEVEA